MAISTTAVGNVDTTVYSSTNTTAVTMLSLCNYTASAVTVDLHVVPSGGTVGADNKMLHQLNIVAGDTYIIYQGGEKIILDNNDFVSVVASASSSVTAVVSYMGM